MWEVRDIYFTTESAVRTVIAIWETQGINVAAGQEITTMPSVYVLDKEVQTPSLDVALQQNQRNFSSPQGLPLQGKTISGYHFNQSNVRLIGTPAESLYAFHFQAFIYCRLTLLFVFVLCRVVQWEWHSNVLRFNDSSGKEQPSPRSHPLRGRSGESIAGRPPVGPIQRGAVHSPF